MRGISILLALIMGTFSHTGYFNRAADTAERAIRKMSGVVVIGKIILQNAERLGSAVGAEDGMPEGTDGEAAASETAEAKEPVSEAAGDTEPEQEKTEPEIGIEIIIDPDGPDADSAFGNGGNGPLLFEFEDPDAKERKEQLPDC